MAETHKADAIEAIDKLVSMLTSIEPGQPLKPLELAQVKVCATFARDAVTRIQEVKRIRKPKDQK
jgi:hypothetical protein